jgi:hypothetical protein
MSDDLKKYALIGGAAFLALWYVKKNFTVAGAVAGVAGAVNNAAGGLGQEVASWFGVPKTNETECEKAKREGRTWDASFACSAGDFLGYAFGSKPAQEFKNPDPNFTKEIITGNKQNGWRYFDDGTVIDQWGRYWKDGKIIWSPT